MGQLNCPLMGPNDGDMDHCSHLKLGQIRISSDAQTLLSSSVSITVKQRWSLGNNSE